MDVIEEESGYRIMFALIPPVVCIGQLFITGTALFVGILLNPLFLVIGIGFGIVTALCIKLFWYRTFFDPSFIGVDKLTRVVWDDEYIYFSGAYFHLKVSPHDVLDYKVYGFSKLNTVKIRIKTEDTVQLTWLSTTMPDKMKFIEYLENIKKIPPPPPPLSERTGYK